MTETWTMKAISAGMEPAKVEYLADRFGDLEPGPAKWVAIGDWMAQELAPAQPVPPRFRPVPAPPVEPKHNGRPHPTVAEWRAENERLRERVAELEQRVAAADDKEDG